MMLFTNQISSLRAPANHRATLKYQFEISSKIFSIFWMARSLLLVGFILAWLAHDRRNCWNCRQASLQVIYFLDDINWPYDLNGIWRTPKFHFDSKFSLQFKKNTPIRFTGIMHKFLDKKVSTFSQKFERFILSLNLTFF